jgi:Zn finger protein HypA/HybF involved in hydrogenase expression
MHDLHEADKILKVTLDYAQKNNLKKVTKATIDLGSMVEHGEELLPANVEFNIKMLAQGTIAEGLEIIINKTKGDSWVLNEIEGE